MHNIESLALSTGLTAKTQQLCLGLESGAADILALVTPTTAQLLMWWFGEDRVLSRQGLNFHAGQKRAILNTIVAHEVRGQDHANGSLLVGTRLSDVAQAKHMHSKSCLKMATGTGKT